jgi:hypothetical protein
LAVGIVGVDKCLQALAVACKEVLNESIGDQKLVVNVRKARAKIALEWIGPPDLSRASMDSRARSDKRANALNDENTKRGDLRRLKAYKDCRGEGRSLLSEPAGRCGATLLDNGNSLHDPVITWPPHAGNRMDIVSAVRCGANEEAVVQKKKHRIDEEYESEEDLLPKEGTRTVFIFEVWPCHVQDYDGV